MEKKGTKIRRPNPNKLGNVQLKTALRKAWEREETLRNEVRELKEARRAVQEVLAETKKNLKAVSITMIKHALKNRELKQRVADLSERNAARHRCDEFRAIVEGLLHVRIRWVGQEVSK